MTVRENFNRSMKKCDCPEHKDGEIIHIFLCPNEDQSYSWWVDDEE